jgi:hypothetical protein
MPERGAQNDVCSLGNFLGICRLDARQTPPTTLALGSGQTTPNEDLLPGEEAEDLLPGPTTIVWYLGVVGFDVVRGARVLE